MSHNTRGPFAVIEVDASDLHEPLAYVHVFGVSRALGCAWADILRDINRHERRKAMRPRFTFHVVDLDTELPLAVTLADGKVWYLPARDAFQQVKFDLDTMQDAIVTYPDSIVPRLPRDQRKERHRAFFRTLADLQAIQEEMGPDAVGTHMDATPCWRLPTGPGGDDDDDDEINVVDVSDDDAPPTQSGGGDDDDDILDLSLDEILGS